MRKATPTLRDRRASRTDMHNFASAASKHLDDVELLMAHEHWDNAAYLSGYVAECAVKALLLGNQMPSPKQLGHDLGVMTGTALHLALILSPARRRYAIPTSREFLDLVKTWQPDERYEPRGHTARPSAESRCKAASEAYERLVITQLLDGRVSFIP